MSGADEAQGGSFAAFNRCVRIRQVCEMTGIARSTIYKYIADGTFPKSFKLGQRVCVWRVATIEAWIAERERA
jgi:prophage regulatory protein